MAKREKSVGGGSSSSSSSTDFQYEIFSASSAHDCNGAELTDYTPNIGVDSATGRLISFEKLTRRNFCDATFQIIIHKDDHSILGISS